MDQQRIDRASSTLIQLGHGDEFNRGTASLREMLRTEGVQLRYDGPWQRPDVDGGYITQAARSLLVIGIDSDFHRGVLALAVAILPQASMMNLMDSAAKLRARLPATELDGLFLKEVESADVQL